VERKFRPFDRETIVGELSTLESVHRGKLFFAMECYAKRDELGHAGPALVKRYGGGIEMIRHQDNEYQGRLLFYEGDAYIILVAYKKETEDVPRRILETAHARMRTHQRS
jgi:phage-related protein